ncbi:TPA: hypothetical protein ACOEDE_004116 [Enterobacter kobei]
MKIDVSTILQLTLTELEKLDPVTVMLCEEQNDGDSWRGNLTLCCAGESWTARWGNMAMPLQQFIMSNSPEYLIGCFAPGVYPTKQMAERDTDHIKSLIIDARRSEEIDASEARELWDEANFHSLTRYDLNDGVGSSVAAFLEYDAYSFEWPEYINPHYRYLERICIAAQTALTELNKKKPNEETESHDQHCRLLRQTYRQWSASPRLGYEQTYRSVDLMH